MLFHILGLAYTAFARATLNVSDTGSTLNLSNDRVTFVMNKTNGIITTVLFEGVNLLGTPVDNTSAIGPYVDIYVPPNSAYDYIPGSGGVYETAQGADSDGTPWGAISMTQPDIEGNVGMNITQYWFLRANETALHAFTRFVYQNATFPNLGEFIQLRTLFRPHGYFFTHLSSTDDFYVPQPRPNPAIDSSKDLGVATQVQDTTWYIGNRTGDPYVENVADYYTKYTMHATYRDHYVHGLYADGTETPDNTTYGAWTIYNSKDTFFGGPTYTDLVVDGLMYNYIISNHYGDGVPNITDGFDRTFGPSIFLLNHGANSSLDELRADAKWYADYPAQFYDEITDYIPGYVPSSGRGSWTATLEGPSQACKAIAILTAPGYDPQDNSAVPEAYQYWADIGDDGTVNISRIAAGSYQLTVYAENVFDQFVWNQTISIQAGETTDSGSIFWDTESHGTELWRLGVPDWTAGEYRHGYQPDPTHPLHPPEYRIYWGNYDFVSDFPEGVNFYIGSSQESADFNYVHWSAFGGDLTRPKVFANATVNNWTVSFDLDATALEGTTTATLTIQLAGVSTSAGNTDSGGSKYSDLPYNVVVNGLTLDPWIIPHYHSSSCATRSGITCYHTAHSFPFSADQLLSNATNEMVLSLPYNVSGVSVMYDAMRLEVG